MTPELQEEMEKQKRVDALKPYLPGVSALITEELVEATRNNGTFICAHHGISVIREEFEEFARRTREVLEHWCKHARAEIRFQDEPINGAEIEKMANKAFSTPAPVLAELRRLLGFKK